MDLQEYIKALRIVFQQELSAKTGWDRNEILQAFDRAVATATIQCIKKRMQ